MNATQLQEVIDLMNENTRLQLEVKTKQETTLKAKLTTLSKEVEYVANRLEHDEVGSMGKHPGLVAPIGKCKRCDLNMALDKVKDQKGVS